jgi:hypothetical protein
VHLIKEVGLISVPTHFALWIKNLNWCLVLNYLQLSYTFRHLIQPVPHTFIPVIHKIRFNKNFHKQNQCRKMLLSSGMWERNTSKWVPFVSLWKQPSKDKNCKCALADTSLSPPGGAGAMRTESRLRTGAWQMVVMSFPIPDTALCCCYPSLSWLGSSSNLLQREATHTAKRAAGEVSLVKERCVLGGRPVGHPTPTININNNWGK